MPIPYHKTGPVGHTVTPNLEGLKDKSVIVTGGSSGLGLAYVKAFLATGAHVTNADLVPPQEGTLEASSNYQFQKCDVRIWAEQLAAFKAAKDNSPHKSIDTVVANAGIAASDPIFRIDESHDPLEPDLKIIDVNVKGVLYTAKLALHYFHHQQRTHPDRDRCLILKSSLAGYVDLVGIPLYQASKYAVRGLMHNLRRLDYLRVNVIAPWFIATPFLSAAHVEILTKTFQASGLDWALAEDSAKAVVRVAADTSVNGRAFGIVPRYLVEEGYVDLEQDDYETGTMLDTLQAGALRTNHRAGPPSWSK